MVVGRAVAAAGAVVLASSVGVGPVASGTVAGAVAATRPSALPVAACFSTDNGNPVVSGLSITPPTVDSRTGEATVVFRVSAEDTGGPGAASGVTRVRLAIGLTANANNWFSAWNMRQNDRGQFVLRVTFFPQDVSTLWYLSLRLRDAVGNAATYSARDLTAAGLPATFTSRTAAPPDMARPRLRTVRLSTTILDVSDHRRTLGLRVRARDDVGVAWMQAWLFGEDNLFTTPVATLRLRSGSPAKGLWRGRIHVPRLAGTETGHLIIEMWDFRGHHRKYLPKRLADIGQPNQVSLRGHVDTERPELRRVSVRPSSLDLSSRDGRVTIQARVTDRGGGVKKVIATLSGKATGLNHQDYDVRLQRVRGTAHDGIWKARVRLPRCLTEAGRWRGYVTAFDYSLPGRSANVRPISVINVDITPPTAEEVGRTPAAGPLTLRFDEDVAGVSVEKINIHQGPNLEDRPGDGPAPIAGTWICRTATGGAVDCINGPVRTAAFTPTSPFQTGETHTVILNPEHHLGLTDLAGNPPVDIFKPMYFLWNDLNFTPR